MSKANEYVPDLYDRSKLDTEGEFGYNIQMRHSAAPCRALPSAA